MYRVLMKSLIVSETYATDKRHVYLSDSVQKPTQPKWLKIVSLIEQPLMSML